MDREPRVLLIGGSSNIGKSTVAARLADRPGWTTVSTDSLARHPGRPWKTAPDVVPPHVAEHYLGLDVDELIASVLAHYRRLRLMMEYLVRWHAGNDAADRLVLEGSALWPEGLAGIGAPGVAGVWLTGPDALFEARIHRESRYHEADARGRAMIDKFIGRTLRFNHVMMDEVLRLGLPFVEIEPSADPRDVAEACAIRAAPLV